LRFVIGFFASLRLGERLKVRTAITGNAIAREIIDDGITRIVNGLEDDDHAKSPSRKET
jgi:hypothetical protein